MDGILPLYKTSGLTSHDCVFKVRKLLRTKKAGHTGTLDPSVTGVLPIAIGEATKIVRFLQDADKSYEATVELGISTTTEDADGEIVEEMPVLRPIRRDEIISILNQFRGDITQIPPMYSAVKVGGKRLYEYAREGKTVERPKRKVQIMEIELLDKQEIFLGEKVRFSIRVRCSKGTYIRTLAVMIGAELGYPAHMAKLIRTESAGIGLDQCVTFEQIEEAIEKDTIDQLLLPMETVLDKLPKYEINDTLAKKVKNGILIPIPETFHIREEPIAVTFNHHLLAIYQRHPEKKGVMKPVRVLNRSFF